MINFKLRKKCISAKFIAKFGIATLSETGLHMVRFGTGKMCGAHY